VPIIVERLDGNPLAIELAASQVVLHPAERILSRLEESLLDMTTAWADVPERQRSLRNAMRSTWTVLSPATRAVWRWASWFEGAFAPTDLPPDLEGQNALLQLRTHSLLRPLAGVGTAPLFAFFKVARQFGRDQAADRPEAVGRAALHGAEQALTRALETQSSPDRAAFTARIPDLEEIAQRPSTLGAKAAILLQRARRQLAVLGRDDATALARLHRLLPTVEDPSDRLAAQVELVWGDLAQGTLDDALVTRLEAQAAALNQPMLRGDLALARAHHFDRGMHIEKARVQCAHAVEQFTAAGQPVWVLNALVEELRHAMHLTLGGAPTPSNLNARFALATRLHSQTGTANQFELLEQLRALDAYRRGDLATARQKTAEGLARTADHETSAVRVQWLQYLHSGMTRSGLHAEAVALGQGMIEQAQRCGTLVGVLAQEQAFALAALDRLDEAMSLLDRTCDEETLGALTLGPIELIRALSALKAGRLEDALQHCENAIDLVRPTDAWNRMTFALSLVGYLQGRMSRPDAARAAFDEAWSILRRFDPQKKTHRAVGIECFECGLDPQGAARLEALEPRTRHGMLARISWMTVRRERAEVATRTFDLRADPAGAWFERPHQDRVDLVGRAALRRLFTELLRRHVAGEHTGLGMYALIEIGWPDEAANAQGGAGRVRAAMHTLRSLGLRGVLINRGGYLLDPEASVELATA
jgi:tetratricopeptide (TPR) repeat protein